MNLEIDVRHVLASIRVPTLILHAKSDRAIPLGAGRYMADHIPNATFVEIDAIDSTIMFTDIVGSTQMAVEKGNVRFGDLLDAHHAAIRSELARHRGEEINTAGDGFLASFDGPARAIKRALAIVKSLDALGLACRIGLHTGECEVRQGRSQGIALHIAARVAALASPRRVFVSQTVKDLVAGSGLGFTDAGWHTLKGLPDEWRIYQVASQ